MKRYNRTKMKALSKNNKRLRRSIASLMVTALIISFFIQSFAYSGNTPKEEVVYINLNNDGSVREIYVVNSFELDQDGRIIDYGDYTAFRQLTSSGRIQTEKDMITIDSKAGKLYYEGTLKVNSIPWLFNIRYFMDGKEYTGEDIAGKSGALEIRMSIRKNPGSKGEFFQNFTLQNTFKLDSSTCKNIRADGAAIANAGRFKQVVFTVFPGKNADISVRADVENFEMEGISINGITMDMDMDFESDPTMTSKLKELRDGVIKLDDGAAKLKDGAKDLSEGTDELKTGVFDLNDGVTDLADGTSELAEGAGELTDGMRELNDAIKDLNKGTKELAKGTKELKDGSKKLLAGANNLQDGIDSLSGGLSRLSSQNDVLTGGAGQIFDSMISAASEQLKAAFPIPDLTRINYKQVIDGILEQIGGSAMQQAMDQAESGITSEVTAYFLEQVKAGYPDADDETIAMIMNGEEIRAQIASTVAVQMSAIRDEIISSVEGGLAADPDYLALFTLWEQLTGYEGFYNGLKAYTAGVSEISSGAVDLAAGMKDWCDGMSELKEGTVEIHDGMVELRDGVIDLKDGTAKLLDGTVDLEEGIIELNDGMIELRDGVIKLLDGAVELYDGTVEFYDGTVTMAEGTLEFRDKTSHIENDMKDIIKEKIDEMLGRNFKPISFVSEKNTEVMSIQFVMQTEEICVPAIGKPQIQPAENMSFFERLLALFGIKK